MIFIFFIIAGLQCSVSFLLYSMVTQLHIHVYILFSHIIMLHHKWLNIVPSATQQDLIASPFQKQEFVSINPKLPTQPTSFPLILFKIRSFTTFHYTNFLVPDILQK